MPHRPAVVGASTTSMHVVLFLKVFQRRRPVVKNNPAGTIVADTPGDRHPTRVAWVVELPRDWLSERIAVFLRVFSPGFVRTRQRRTLIRSAELEAQYNIYISVADPLTAWIYVSILRAGVVAYKGDAILLPRPH